MQALAAFSDGASNITGVDVTQFVTLASPQNSSSVLVQGATVQVHAPSCQAFCVTGHQLPGAMAGSSGGQTGRPLGLGLRHKGDRPLAWGAGEGTLRVALAAAILGNPRLSGRGLVWCVKVVSGLGPPARARPPS